MPYSDVAVDLFKDLDQLAVEYDYDAILEEVHPEKTSEYMSDVFLNTVDMVRIEQWHLVDYVQAPTQ